MLEADEFDDDYFTPASNTPLSNIFNAPANELTNDSLKFKPPKKPKQVIVESKPSEDLNVTECIVACAITAYEWEDNKYTHRGKLGFAIINTPKHNIHNIILYNASKTTISTVTVTSKLCVTIKGKKCISYYDNTLKYWTLYAGEDELQKITETLKKLDVEIKYVSTTDAELHVPSGPSHEMNKSDKESDTDCSSTKKTKASILVRMANMGQSVLPPNKQRIEKSSDSSDSSEIKDKPKIVKQKPKGFGKRIEKNMVETLDPVDTTTTAVAKLEHPVGSLNMYTFVNGQLVPVTNSSISNYGPSNDMNLFITEQRVHNNEIRINMNRNTDKLDQVLEKVRLLDMESKSTNSLQTEITQKLITEYEKKIQIYEEILASNKINLAGTLKQPHKCNEIQIYKDKLSELNNLVTEKDMEILRLREALKNKIRKDSEICSDTDLSNKITDLEKSLLLKTQELENFVKDVEDYKLKGGNVREYENKLKYTMNAAFQTMSANFQDDVNYSGDHIKAIIASVIKKVTVQSLSEYNMEK